MTEAQNCLLFRRNVPLLIFTLVYILSVIFYFTAFGVGLNPLNAAIIISEQAPRPAAPPLEPGQAPLAPLPPPPTNQHLDAIKSIGKALGLVWWILGMGAPIIGVLSYFGIWVGVNEKRFSFVRVVRLGHHPILALFRMKAPLLT